MVSVSLQDVVKSFKEVVALDQVNIQVENGEFFTLLGPSGCGKTTALRVLAGFYQPDSGQVYFDGNEVTNVPPEKRNTAMVFQNYALFPHKTVFENIAYGLRVRRIHSTEVTSRVGQASKSVGLEGLESRFPSQLSGGQQQRVALARAIVVEPQVLLLDEPLSNLDAKLRLTTRAELTKLQKRLGITSIYVTHDQEEALSISDRTAVMLAGRVVQVGTPREIYENPQNRFVADFIGIANFIKAKVRSSENSRVELETLTGSKLFISGDERIGSDVLLLIRPESLQLHTERGADMQPNVLRGKIWHLSYLGDVIRYEIQNDSVEGGILKADVRHGIGGRLLSEGEEAAFYFAPESAGIVREN